MRPPPLLYVKGNAGHLTRPMVAIVGARNGSAAGQKLARLFASHLGTAGFVIASGLARGIDAAAHDAALDDGNRGRAGWRHRQYLSTGKRRPAARDRRARLPGDGKPAGLRAARPGFSAPQPHHLGPLAGRADRRSGTALRHVDHRPHGRRAGTGGVRHSRPPSRSAGRGHQCPHQVRRNHGDGARGCPERPGAHAAREPRPAVSGRRPGVRPRRDSRIAPGSSHHTTRTPTAKGCWRRWDQPPSTSTNSDGPPAWRPGRSRWPCSSSRWRGAWSATAISWCPSRNSASVYSKRVDCRSASRTLRRSDLIHHTNGV